MSIELWKQLPLGFYVTFAAIFGLIFGSFSNVLIWRIPRKESILKPGSHCPHCNKPIRPYDNIPVISYLFLLFGKCRDCKTHISIRYPIIELLTSLIAIWGVVVWNGDPIRQLLSILLSPIMISLAMIDFDSMELPDSLITVIAVLGLIAVPLVGGTDAIWQTVVLFGIIAIVTFAWHAIFGRELSEEEIKLAEESEPSIKERFIWGGTGFLIGAVCLVGGFYASLRIDGWNAIWGFLVGGGGLLALWGLFLFLQGREAIGLGDVKLMAAIGIITGPGLILLAYLFGALLGMLIWAATKFKSKSKEEQPFPFGPALIAGAWVSWLHGNELLKWYLAFFLKQM